MVDLRDPGVFSRSHPGPSFLRPIPSRSRWEGRSRPGPGGKGNPGWALGSDQPGTTFPPGRVSSQGWGRDRDRHSQAPLE